MIELTPILDKESNTPLYIQLAEFIRREILAGRIKPKEKLPSKRNLAKHLGLSLNTVQGAYDQICAEGYAESRPRSGLFVKNLDHDLFQDRVSYQESVQHSTDVKEDMLMDFNSGKIDTEHFPYKAWRKLAVQSLFEDSGELFHMGHPQGEPELRRQIVKHIYASRGVRCSADQIVIGAGTQVLIGLLCLLIGREQIYAIEEPGFYRTRTVLEDLGVQVAPIPLEEDGINLKVLNQTHAHAVYVTPSHQFPLGMVMPISLRMGLLNWAEEKGSYIIEDDYDGEYRYKGKPIPSLQGLDRNGKVIYLGTFSKALIPSIRISYLVLPLSLIKKYREHYSIYKQTVSRFHQDTLYRFMKEGLWQRHLNKMRTLYRKKQHVLLAAIQSNFGDKVRVIGEHSGLHIVLEVNSRMEETELIQKAMNAGVKVYPLSIHFNEPIERREPKILLGFGALSEQEIEKGVMLLKEAWGL